MKTTLLRSLKNPVAIAMWDFSWILRSYEGGGFENIEKALDGLVERGYNAIRIDCFPHLIACNERDEFFYPYDQKTCSVWHHGKDVTINPKKSLIKLLGECKARGIYVALSTWMQQPENRVAMESKEDFINAWESTITFIKENDLWHNILYVDFLNEYPYCHGFSALKIAAKMADKKFSSKVSESNLLNGNIDRFGKRGKEYLKNFSSEIIKYFSQKYNDVDFAFCITTCANHFKPDELADFNSFQFYDLHLWFSYFNSQHKLAVFQVKLDKSKSPQQWNEIIKKIEAHWSKNDTKMVKWMEQNFQKHLKWAENAKAPVGNTEGWGFVGWPISAENWEYQKRAAEICVALAIKYNYSFICTTNFTHPHFEHLWKDVEWHKKMTNIIKSAEINRKYN